MCGISGFIVKKEMPEQKALSILKIMNVCMEHRGPDDQGVFFNGSCGLSHRRLAIIDLSPAAHQPMSDPSGKIWITYNGEIYNFHELRRELKEKGYTFSSQSDTEVLLLGYIEWGIEKLLKNLRGMFAFALYDKRCLSGTPPKLYLARDRFGIKPLYYWHNHEYFIFSSEVRALIKCGLVSIEREKEAEISFLLLGYVPSPLTTARNIFSLPPGSFMKIENNEIQNVCYYSLENSILQSKNINLVEACQKLESLLEKVVSIHLISDAPIGIFLSGGIDSSALVALSSSYSKTQINTVSIVFREQQYSEKSFQKLIVDRYRTIHHEIEITDLNFYQGIEEILNAMDQPTVDGINTFMISKAARQTGLKVVLSGVGGDELFLGYDSFRKIQALQYFQSFPFLLKYPFLAALHFQFKWKKLNYLLEKKRENLYLALRGLYLPEDIADIFDLSVKEVKDAKEKIFMNVPFKHQEEDWLTWLSRMELTWYLQSQLLKDTDIMSMHHSVEIRVPFLDHELVEYVLSLDSTIKYDPKIPKSLLIRTLNPGLRKTEESVPQFQRKNFLPDEIIFRKKQGFTFPFDLWLKENTGEELFQDALSKGNINKKGARKIWDRFRSGRLHWSRVWALIVIGLFG